MTGFIKQRYNHNEKVQMAHIPSTVMNLKEDRCNGLV